MILILGVAILLFPKSASSLTYNIQSAVSRALKANPTIEEKLHALEAAKMNIGVAQSYFWPRVSLVTGRNILHNYGGVGNTDQLSSEDYSYGLRLSWNLFSGFTHLNNVQMSMIQKDIAELTKKQAEIELAANVKGQFFGYLQAKRNLRLAKESIKRVETQLKAAEAMSSEDLVPYVNVLQNRVDLAQAQEMLISSQNALETARLMLNRYLDHAPSEMVEYKGELEDFPLNYKVDQKESVDLAMKRRPEVLIAQKSMDAARKSMYAAAGQALPQVDLNYDTMHNQHDYDSSRYRNYDRDYWGVGVNLSWTFFEGGKTVFGTMAEKKRGDSLYAAYRNTLEGAKTDVLRAIMDLESARKVYDTAKSGIAAATETYAQTRERYDSGIGAITDLLDAQTKLTTAEVTLSRAMADYQTAYCRYQYFIGGE